MRQCGEFFQEALDLVDALMATVVLDGLAEIQRAIQEVEPVKPSAQLQCLGSSG